MPKPDSSNEINDVFDKYIIGFRQRTMIKPGLTGLAQVSGRNGLNLQQRIDKDLEYQETMSAGLDIKILWRTIVNVFKGDGTS